MGKRQVGVGVCRFREKKPKEKDAAIDFWFVGLGGYVPMELGKCRGGGSLAWT